MNPGAFANQMAIPAMTQRLERSHKTIFGTSVQGALSESARTAGRTSLVVLAVARPVTPAKLASHYPAGVRAQAQQLFGDLLEGYGRIEQQFDIPKRDLAGAVSAFIVGCYVAYHDVDFPDENFRPLVRQMRQALAARDDIERIPVADRQEAYEQLAILGMFMATTHLALKQSPQPAVAADLRRVARSHLEAFLKVDAERVDITGQGLVIKSDGRAVK